MAVGEQYNQGWLEGIQRSRSKVDFYSRNVDPALASRASELAEENPWMSPSTLLAMARGNASPEAIARLNVLRFENGEDKPSDGESWLRRNVINNVTAIPGAMYGNLKGALRTAQALGESTYELAINRVTARANPEEQSLRDYFGSTKFGTLMSGVDPGEGFFLSDEFRAEQERRAIEFRGTTQYGEGQTGGRAVRDILDLDPTSTAGNAVSGVIDGTLSVIMDPVGVVAKGIRGLGLAISGAKRANILTKAGIEVTEKWTELGRTARYVPSSGPDFALVERLKKAKTIREIEEIRRARGLEVMPQTFDVNGVPRTLLEGEMAAVVRGGGTVDLIDDIDLLVSKGEISSAQADALRAERSSVMSSLRTRTETEIWDTSRAKAVLKHDPRAVFLAKTISEMDVTRPGLAHRIRRDIFKGKMSLEDAEEIASVVRRFSGNDRAIDEVQNVLLGFADRLNSTQSVGTLDLNKLAGRGVQARTGARAAVGLDPTERFFSQGEWRRIFGWQYTPRLGVLGNSRQRMDAVDNFERFVDMALPQLSSDERLGYVDEFMSLVTQRTVAVIDESRGATQLGRARVNASAAAYRARQVTEEVVNRMLKAEGVSDEVADGVRLKREKMYEAMREYAIDATKEGHMDALRFITNTGLMTEDEIIASFAKRGIFVNSIDELRSVGPELYSDLFDKAVLLPEPDVVRGLTRNKYIAATLGRPFRSLETGQVRSLVRYADYAMNDIWRKFVLAQVGYFTRNVLDGQARAWMTGHASLLTSPMNWFTYFTSNPRIARGLYDLRGKMIHADQLDELRVMAVDDLSNADEIIMNAMNTQRWEMNFGSPNSTARQQFQSGKYDMVPMGSPQYKIGMIDQMRKIHFDPQQRLYMMFSHLPENERAARMMSWLYETTDGQKLQAQLIEHYLGSGLLAQTAGAADVVGLQGRVSPELSGGLRADWARMTPLEARTRGAIPDSTGRAIADRRVLLEQVVGNIVAQRSHQFDQVPEFVAMSVGNRVPVIGPNGRAVIEEITIPERVVRSLLDRPSPGGYKATRLDEMTGRIWKQVDNSQKPPVMREYYIYDVVDESGRLRVIEVTDEIVWSKTGQTENYSDAAINLVDDLTKRPQSIDPELRNAMPANVGYAVRIDPKELKVAEKANTLVEAMGEIVFSGTYQGRNKMGRWWSDKLSTGRNMIRVEKIPYIRENYHKHVLDNITDLSREEALRVRQDVLAISRQHGMTPNQAMGGSKSPKGNMDDYWKRLNDVLDNPNTQWGRGNIDELSEYAYLRSTSDMQDLFFDASTRTNMDANAVMRVQFAFVMAWANIMKDFSSLMIRHPDKVYRAHRTIKGMSNFRLSNESSGAFSQDPITGDYQYAFPLSQNVFRTLFGENVAMVSRIKGFSMGLNGVPALSPIGNATASFVLKGLRRWGGDAGDAVSDAFESSMLQYGSIDSWSEFAASFSPASIRKLASAMAADKTRASGAFANNYTEALIVMAGSGEYDLEGPNEVAEYARLEEDASNIARAATAMSAFMSFMGPAAANPEFFVETKLGKIPFAVLAQELQRMREEDYETGLLKFIATYGPTVKYMVAGKTRAEVPGLSATEPFFQFQRDNPDLFERHKQVAGYLAPEGDVFEWEARQYALERGYVRPLRGRELIEANQYAIGASLYRAERKKFGAFPTKQQQEYLRNYRVGLHEMFPGYPPVPKFDTAKLEMFIQGIGNAIKEPEWANLPISNSIRQYLQIRDGVLAKLRDAGYAGFRSKGATGAREYMRSEAAILMQQNPEFERVYRRIFAAEVVLPGESDDQVDESLVEN